MADKANTKVVKIDDGLEIEVNGDFMDDVETLEVMDRMATSPEAIIPFVKKIFGEDNYQTVKAHYVEKNGRMRISDLNDVVNTVAAAFPKA